MKQEVDFEIQDPFTDAVAAHAFSPPAAIVQKRTERFWRVCGERLSAAIERVGSCLKALLSILSGSSYVSRWDTMNFVHDQPEPRRRSRSKTKGVSQTLDASQQFVRRINRAAGFAIFDIPKTTGDDKQDARRQLAAGRGYRHILFPRTIKSGGRGPLLVMEISLQDGAPCAQFDLGSRQLPRSRRYRLDQPDDLTSAYSAFGAFWGAVAGGTGDKIKTSRLRAFQRAPEAGLRLLIDQLNQGGRVDQGALSRHGPSATSSFDSYGSRPH